MCGYAAIGGTQRTAITYSTVALQATPKGLTPFWCRFLFFRGPSMLLLAFLFGFMVGGIGAAIVMAAANAASKEVKGPHD